MTKNDLSAFKRSPTKGVLNGSSKQPTTPAQKGKVGKPRKSDAEQLSKRCQVMLTLAEFEKLEADRGGVPLSAYLRMKLKEKGII